MTDALRVHFTDFSSDFVVEDEYFLRLLRSRYDVCLDSKSPDWLFYSCYGDEHLKFDCVRIFYTAENLRPDFNLCDYALGFDYLDFGDRYFRLPNYARYGKIFHELFGRDAINVGGAPVRSRFCNFIYTNAHADPRRDELFHKLNGYRPVDSPGGHLNNMAGDAGARSSSDWRKSKVAFQRQYKFSLALENSSTPGYTTEKIMQAFAARTIPIYWGNPRIEEDFNGGAFVNAHRFSSFDEVVSEVARIDTDDGQYIAMLNEPCFSDAKQYERVSEVAVRRFLDHIVCHGPIVARRRARFGATAGYEASAKRRSMLEKSEPGDSLWSKLRRLGVRPTGSKR